MRRLLASLSAVSLLIVAAGCHHVAGACDCDIPGHDCAYGCCWNHIVPRYLKEGLPQPEPIKEMPKEAANPDGK